MEDRFEKNRVVTKKLLKLGFDLHPPDKPLYKFVPISDARLILGNGNLMYQIPEKFNDPLDPHLALIDMSEYVRNHNKKYSGFTDLEALYKKSMAISKQITRQMVNTTGVLSLTVSHTHTLMWSHYAEKHTGVCFGFKDLGFDYSDGIDAINVKYADKVEPLLFTEPFKSISNTVAMINLFCTKARVWEYEREVRIMAYGRAGLHPINPGRICEIYFGVNTPDETVKEILHLAGSMGHKLETVGKMAISDEKFDLDVQLITS